MITPFIKNSELVIGLVTTVGTDHSRIVQLFKEILTEYDMEVNLVKITKLIKEIKIKQPDLIQSKLVETPENKRIESYMDAGTEIRYKTEKGEILAFSAAVKIHSIRPIENKSGKKLERTAHIIRSLKHPDEVQALKNIYGSGFYLVGVSSSKEKRLDSLKKKCKINEEKAMNLISRDQEEEGKALGQQTRKAFELSDFFIEELDDYDQTKEQIKRIIDLIFGHPYITPNQAEHAMFLAYASSLRSADLSRQVGAVILSRDGEIIATGANDVPKAGGGQYWPGHNDRRDYKKGEDSNQIAKENLITDAIERINKYISGELECTAFKEELLNNIKNKEATDSIRKILKNRLDIKAIENGKNKQNKSLLDGSPILDIIEYGRIVHAEMEALTVCSRIGISPRGGTLFVTTFPCHNCAKHIVDAGITEVIYIEPYPKSQAKELHSDAIEFKTSAERQDCNNKYVIFKPFVGVGPRRFFDLFSMKLGSGTSIKRKEGGKTIQWYPKKAQVRVQLQPTSYIDREAVVSEKFKKILEEISNEE